LSLVKHREAGSAAAACPSSGPGRAEHALRVLYVDIEGGFGGSSRSLFYMVAALDRARFEPTVWHRSSGPIGQRLDQLGVSHRVEARIASIIPRPKNNWKIWLTSVPRLLRLPDLARSIRDEAPDLLHLNYEGLVPLHVALCRTGARIPTVMHVRTMSPANAIYRAYARHINRHVDHLIFITENERGRAAAAGVDVGRVGNSVLYNPVSADMLSAPDKAARSGPLRIVYLGTLDHPRAPDRLIGLAAELRHRSIACRIDCYGGAQRYRKLFIFPHRTLEELRARVDAEALGEWIAFHGHVGSPEDELRSADLLIRPARAGDPWGRDVIEALACGTPAIATGSFDRFVRSGETGFLFETWDDAAIAAAIGRLSEDRPLLQQLSANARTLARSLFDPAPYAARIAAIYNQVLTARRAS
jgi:glycosyltransferase involved in cell wall biosynthesis